MVLLLDSLTHAVAVSMSCAHIYISSLNACSFTKDGVVGFQDHVQVYMGPYIYIYNYMIVGESCDITLVLDTWTLVNLILYGHCSSSPL